MNQSEATKKMQNVQLEILKDFQNVCEKHKIPYFVSGGTAIGVMRHKGFIPWDDDIDVCLLRSDYNKVLYYIREEFSDKYDIYDSMTVKEYVLVFARMCKKGTKFQEDGEFDTCVPTGIFMDIFAYDKTVADEKKRKKQIRDAWFWARMCVLSEYKHPQFPKGLSRISLMLAKAGCLIIHYMCRLLHIKKKFCYKHYMKVVNRYQDSKDGLYIDFSYSDPEKIMCTKEMIFPLKKGDFENIQVSMLNDADKYLSSQYGDYMKLPPEDQRKTHNPKYIDFGDGTVYRKR